MKEHEEQFNLARLNIVDKKKNASTRMDCMHHLRKFLILFINEKEKRIDLKLLGVSLFFFHTLKQFIRLLIYME